MFYNAFLWASGVFLGSSAHRVIKVLEVKGDGNAMVCEQYSMVINILFVRFYVVMAPFFKPP